VVAGPVWRRGGGIALFAGNNPGTVTLFWPPHRVDLSLNLVLVLASLLAVPS
jgi:hypothetical protein